MIIPKEINLILEKLDKNGYEAYAVGGCVRDLVLSEIEGRDTNPKDWDITTNANPKELQKLFPKNFYENQFGTVSVITDSKDDGEYPGLVYFAADLVGASHSGLLL